jgi:hypothetical protein
MTTKHLNGWAETPTSSLEDMNQAQAESLVDLLYTQRLVTNGNAVLASQAQPTRRLTQSLSERSSKQSEAFATLLSVAVETSLRFFFFAPLSVAQLFFVRGRAEEIESGDGREQQRELASQREYSLSG